jgi:hypothetical protein
MGKNFNACYSLPKGMDGGAWLPIKLGANMGRGQQKLAPKVLLSHLKILLF